jgi:hypothetical protein
LVVLNVQPSFVGWYKCFNELVRTEVPILKQKVWLLISFFGDQPSGTVNRFLKPINSQDKFNRGKPEKLTSETYGRSPKKEILNLPRRDTKKRNKKACILIVVHQSGTLNHDSRL